MEIKNNEKVISRGPQCYECSASIRTSESIHLSVHTTLSTPFYLEVIKIPF